MRVRNCCLAAFKDDAMAKLRLRLVFRWVVCVVTLCLMKGFLGHGGDAKQRLAWMVG